MSLTLDGRTFGPEKPALIVAEIGGNHGGDFAQAKRLVLEASRAGATAVKFQCYTPDELVALRGDGPAPAPWSGTLRDLWERSATPFAWFPDLFAYARELGLIPFSSVFGVESLACLEAVQCPAYKVASPDRRRDRLLRLLKRTHKPLLVSSPNFCITTPGTYTLYCPPGYPTKEINWMAFLNGTRDYYDIEPGYLHGFSCHRHDAILGPMARAHGAWILEFHLMLPDTNAPDQAFALTPFQFARLVTLTREAERALGIP